MTDRTCLDVAAEAIDALWPASDFTSKDRVQAALDAIHPALANLTPDDVAALFNVCLRAWNELGPYLRVESTVPDHAWEVLSRD